MALMDNGPGSRVARSILAFIAAAAVYLAWSIVVDVPEMIIPGFYFILVIVLSCFSLFELLLRQRVRETGSRRAVLLNHWFFWLVTGALAGYIADVIARIIALATVSSFSAVVNESYWGAETGTRTYWMNVLMFASGGMLAGSFLGAGTGQLTVNQRRRMLAASFLVTAATAFFLASLFIVIGLCPTPPYVYNQNCDQSLEYAVKLGLPLVIVLQAFLGWLLLEKKMFPGQVKSNTATIIAAGILFIVFVVFTWFTAFILFAEIY